MEDLPAAADRPLVERIAWVPGAREWTGNENSDDQHHGLVSLNESPLRLRLLWQSSDSRETVEVGTFKINLRGLVAKEHAQQKAGLKVRLRFVRSPDGVISIQANDSGPALDVGYAQFD